MSKAALEILALTYAQECDGTNVRVNLSIPVPMRTMMRAKAMPGEDPSTLTRPERSGIPDRRNVVADTPTTRTSAN